LDSRPYQAGGFTSSRGPSKVRCHFWPRYRLHDAEGGTKNRQLNSSQCRLVTDNALDGLDSATPSQCAAHGWACLARIFTQWLGSNDSLPPNARRMANEAISPADPGHTQAANAPRMCQQGATNAAPQRSRAANAPKMQAGWHRSATHCQEAGATRMQHPLRVPAGWQRIATHCQRAGATDVAPARGVPHECSTAEGGQRMGPKCRQGGTEAPRTAEQAGATHAAPSGWGAADAAPG